MKKILILNTGGTISMSEDHTTGKVSPTENNPIGIGGDIFSHMAHIYMENLYNLPSPHITEFEMFELKQRIMQAIEEGYEGVVVTHGTDTLEETAYYLELTLDVLQYSGIDLRKWLHGFDDVFESVSHDVDMIINHPLMPKDIPVHGLVINPEDGKVEVVVNGYSNMED